MAKKDQEKQTFDLDKAETQSVVGTDKTAADVAVDSTAEINKAAEAGAVAQATPTYTPVNGANASGSKISEAEMKRDVERAAKALGSAKKKSISIPKQLAPMVGETMFSCINGACIRVPVDGETYEIPEPYHELITNSLKTINSGDVRATLPAGANDTYLDGITKPGL